MKFSFRNFLVYFLLILFLGILAMVYFSPYGKNANNEIRQVRESIIMNSSSEEVFNFLGDSDNAEDWSVFVDHISPLNSHKVKDGEVHSERRCFAQADEKGMSWDERVTAVEPLKRRQLHCYNFKNFYISAGELITEQVYETLENGNCKLTFTLFMAGEDNSFLDELKFYYAGYTISDVFRKNLANIKNRVGE